MKKKFLGKASAMALLSLSVVFSACGGTAGNRGNDGRTVLTVGVYDSGVDAAWMDKMEEDYEALHQDVDVQLIKKGKEYEQQNLINTILNDEPDMYFTHIVNVCKFAEEELLLDITDVMKGKADVSEEKTIEEKCTSPQILNYFKDKEGEDGKYYGMPYYSTLAGLVYDVDLFEEKGLFLKEGGGYISPKGTETRTKGRDGVSGTTDDGLPVTYAEFKALCEHMVTRGVTPFTWGYQAGYTRDNFISAVIANYEGLNDFSLNFSLEGTDSQFGAITAQNGNLLLGQKGKEHALTFA